MAIDAIAMASGLSQPDWEIKKLGEIAGLNLGRTPRRDVRLYWEDGEIPWVSIADLNNGLVETTKEKISKQAFSETFQSKIVSAGSLLLSFKLTIGKVGILKMDATHNEAIASIQPNPEIIDRDFLFYQLQNLNYDEYLDAYVKGRTLNKEKLQILNIFLPPLPEQRAIARVLTTVRQAIEATERVIEATRQLKKAMMKHLFTYGPVPVHAVDGVQLKETEIGWVPEGWEVRNLGDLIEKPDYGFTASASINKVGPKFLRITDITDEGRVEWNTVPHCLATKKETQKYQLKNGDILIARIGATTGKSYRVHQCPEAIFASYLIRLRCREGILESRYLYQYTNTEMYWDQINSNKGGRLKGGVNIPILTGLMIPYPSIEEQLEIQSILDHIDTKLNAEKHRKLALETLFQSMLDSLMTGKIRVDESDGAFN